MDTVGDRIRMARERRGLTQEQLAMRLGYEGANRHATVAKWENNQGPSVGNLEPLIRTLGVNGDWLVTGEGQMERGSPGTEAVRLHVIGKVVDGTLDDETVRRLAAIESGEAGERKKDRARTKASEALPQSGPVDTDADGPVISDEDTA